MTALLTINYTLFIYTGFTYLIGHYLVDEMHALNLIIDGYLCFTSSILWNAMCLPIWLYIRLYSWGIALLRLMIYPLILGEPQSYLCARYFHYFYRVDDRSVSRRYFSRYCYGNYVAPNRNHCRNVCISTFALRLLFQLTLCWLILLSVYFCRFTKWFNQISCFIITCIGFAGLWLRPYRSADRFKREGLSRFTLWTSYACLLSPVSTFRMPLMIGFCLLTPSSVFPCAIHFLMPFEANLQFD